MIRIQLSPAGAARLEALFRATADRKLRDRLQIVLMAHRGRVRQDIAADLGVHRKTVTRWLNAYCDGGPGGLQPKKAPGKPGKIPAALADEVRRWVIDGPAKQGLDRANPHLEFKRLPSYSPQLNPIERLWKKLRRRATHNRLFDALADLKASIRASLCYFQTMRGKVKSIIEGRPRRKVAK